MPITYRNGGAALGTSQAITSIAAGVVTTGSTVANAAVGRIAKIENCTVSENNVDGYVCTAVSGTNYTLRPAPTNASDGDLSFHADVNNRGSARTISTITAFPGGTYGILVTGNDPINNIKPGDAVIITNNPTAANNGRWGIHSRVAKRIFILRPPDDGAGVTTDVSGTGSAQFKAGAIRIDITDTTVDTDDLLTMTPVAGPGGSTMAWDGGDPSGDALSPSGNKGAEDIMGYLNINGTDRELFAMNGISGFFFNTSTDTTFTCANKLFINTRQAQAFNTDVGDVLQGARLLFTQVGTGNVTVQFGLQEGNDISFSEGCPVYNVYYPYTEDLVKIDLFGSWFGFPAGGFPVEPRTAVGSVVSEFVGLTDVTDWNTVSLYGTQPFASIAAATPLSLTNILIGSATLAATLYGPSTIKSILISDDVPTPVLQTNDANIVTILDPLSDLDITDGSLVGAWQKDYTFNPRFVYTPSGSVVPIVVSIYVTVTEINETTKAETVLFSGWSDPVTGLINGGAGVAVRRQGTGADFAHRIETSGAGFPTRTHTIQLFSSVLQRDWPVDEDAPAGPWIKRYDP